VNLCRHCTRRKAVRPRDLCFPCYGNRNIRRQYEPTTEFGRRCVEWNTTARSIKNRERPLAERTEIPPGPDRVAVYRARNEMGLSIWHPEDEGNFLICAVAKLA